MGVQVPPRTRQYPMRAHFWACRIVTQARPSVAAGAVPGCSLPSWSVDAGWFLADGDGLRIPGAVPQGPRGRVVDERDVGDPQMVDQVGGLSRRRDLGTGLFSAHKGMTAVGVQNGQGGQ